MVKYIPSQIVRQDEDYIRAHVRQCGLHQDEGEESESDNRNDEGVAEGQWIRATGSSGESMNEDEPCPVPWLRSNGIVTDEDKGYLQTSPLCLRVFVVNRSLSLTRIWNLPLDFHRSQPIAHEQSSARL
jgi:hypothetical protein